MNKDQFSMSGSPVADHLASSSLCVHDCSCVEYEVPK
jgi:hypothetical protein